MLQKETNAMKENIQNKGRIITDIFDSDHIGDVSLASPFLIAETKILSYLKRVSLVDIYSSNHDDDASDYPT